MDQKGYVIEEMLGANTLLARIKAMAAEISLHYENADHLLVVVMLRGAFVFAADLVREINLPVAMDFMEVSSYNDGMQSSRNVQVLKDVRSDISGKDVLLVEDIVDSGHTMKHVLQLLQQRQPNSLSVCTLLDKPSRREVEIQPRWRGFEIPDEFVVGYGLDYGQRHRNLPYIGKVKMHE